MRSGRAALLCLFVLAAPRPSAAEEGALHELSLAEATRLALERNHEISIRSEALASARAGIERAHGSYDPVLGFDVGYRDHTDPVNSLLSGAPPGSDAPELRGLVGAASAGLLLGSGGSLSLSTSVSRNETDSVLVLLTPSYSSSLGVELRQPLLRNREIDPARLRLRVSRTERDRSLASFVASVADTVAAVEDAYWTLVAARRDVIARESSVALAQSQRRETRYRIDAGELPESDFPQTTAEVERRTVALLSARETALRAETRLKSLLLDDADDPLWNATWVAEDLPGAGPREVDLEQALADARELRPEIAEAQAVVERESLELAGARDRTRPVLDVVGSYARRGLAGEQNPDALELFGAPVTVPDGLSGSLGRSWDTVLENRFPDVSLGLSMTIPVGNDTALADARIAESRRHQSELRLARTIQRIEVEVRDAIVGLETAAQRVRAARAGREASELQLTAEQERFASGAATNFLVLTRQDELARARVTETAALADYRKSATELDRATGTLLARRGIVVEDLLPESAEERGGR